MDTGAVVVAVAGIALAFTGVLSWIALRSGAELVVEIKVLWFRFFIKIRSGCQD
jgi:hypothetical protein